MCTALYSKQGISCAYSHCSLIYKLPVNNAGCAPVIGDWAGLNEVCDRFGHHSGALVLGQVSHREAKVGPNIGSDTVEMHRGGGGGGEKGV